MDSLDEGDGLNRGSIVSSNQQVVDGVGGGTTVQYTAEDEVRGETAGMQGSQQHMTSLVSSVPEQRKVGKVYEADTNLNDVVQLEMARIQKAFDKRVVDHTEELVNIVQSGQPLVSKTNESIAPGASTKKK